MSMRICLAMLSVFWGATPHLGETSGCSVATAKDGQAVKFRGTVFLTGHDRFVRPIECTDYRVILVDGDSRVSGRASVSVRRDAAYREFTKYSREEWPLKPNEYGTGPARHLVTADFEGVLEVAPSAGFTRDSKTGRVIGLEGYGHPMPFTRYRLLMTGVSNVRAEEQPKL